MKNKKSRNLFLFLAIIVFVLAGIAFLFWKYIPASVHRENFHTVTVDRGAVMLSMNATGLVDSENEVLILSPGPEIIQDIFAEAGSRVQKGDLIMQLYTGGVKDEIENLKDELEVRRNNLDRTYLTAQSSRLDLEYNEEVKKLRIISLKSQLADQEKLLDVGGISPARIDQTKQEIVLAEKDLKTLVEKNSLRLKQLEAEEKGLLLQIRMQEKQLEEKELLLQKMSIRAPSSGIILSVTGRVGEKVGTDNLLVRMSDLSSFKITGSIDEQLASQLKTGNQVLVQIDQEEQLEGTIGNVTPVVENNKVQFNVHLKENNHPKLIANQQVEIQIINRFKEDALRIKRIPEIEMGNRHCFFVIEGTKAIKKEFSLGIMGNDYCEILSGLLEGDVVVIDGLGAFKHLNEIQLEN
ncbi:MAG: efflux RND transporter periplasmic adaptor subunit [Mariniphaga sp.]|nr:efflux RND transporter periplasmic adaptor subunit [Mariniphaga sp.]MDD4225841.1 efflux RND transporter periplasmic adaptor subunit [Mariniphaga sp.]